MTSFVVDMAFEPDALGGVGAQREAGLIDDTK